MYGSVLCVYTTGQLCGDAVTSPAYGPTCWLSLFRGQCRLVSPAECFSVILSETTTSVYLCGSVWNSYVCASLSFYDALLHFYFAPLSLCVAPLSICVAPLSVCVAPLSVYGAAFLRLIFAASMLLLRGLSAAHLRLFCGFYAASTRLVCGFYAASAQLNRGLSTAYLRLPRTCVCSLACRSAAAAWCCCACCLA